MSAPLRERLAMVIHKETTQIPGPTPHECDYAAADAVIEEIGSRPNTELWILRHKLRKLAEELENEIPGNRANEYEAGCSSGRQRAITAIEAILGE